MKKTLTCNASISVIAVLMAGTFTCCRAFAAEGPVKAPETRTRYLLLDSRIIESAENAKLTLGAVHKDDHNPLFGEDRFWEKRFDNLYANVIFDQEEQLYKCWYSPFIVDRSAKGMSLQQRGDTGYRPPRGREMAICYAASKDGIKWEKPELGLAEFEGSRQNNIVWRGPHGAGVFKDDHDADPARRHKAFFQGVNVAFSADGIHWGKAIACPEIKVAGDTHNNALWAPTLGKYVAITRTWGGADRVRQVARTESDDFLKWTPAQVVLEGLEKNLQVYAMPVFYHDGVYLGLAAIHDQKQDRVWTELTWSPDTVQWHRVSPGTPLIANGGKEMDYDWGCAYAGAYPVFLADEIRIYYGGSDGKHTSWRNGFFCLATLKPDHWAGYEPVKTDQPAILTTAEISHPGQPLRITADVGQGGSIKVSAVDRNGKLISSAKPVTQTVTDDELQWDRKIKPSLMRLRFEISGAKLYSFSFAGAASAASALGAPASADRDFVDLFDGKTLAGWHAVPEESASDWSVQDGVIIGRGSVQRQSYLVWKDAEIASFELELSYRLPGKGNTGVEIRSQPDRTGKRAFEAYHADLGHVGIGGQILGAWDFHFATRKEYDCPRGTRLLINEDGTAHSSPINDALSEADVHRDQWNRVRIVARRNHFQYFINNKLSSEFTDNAKKGRLDRGAIGLQIHDKGMQVEFKDVRLKRLSPTEQPTATPAPTRPGDR
jgi:hypothetical protein